MIMKIDNLIRSKNSKEAFLTLNRLTIIHPSKRDGGIMKCFLDENDNLQVNNDTIILNCIE